MNKRILWFAIILAGVCLCIGALTTVGYWAIRQIPTVNSQIPPGSNPIQINIDYPTNQKLWPMDAQIPVSISGWSENPITQVDLYINNTLYKSFIQPAGRASEDFLGTVQWQPGQAGKFSLVARATDSSGNSGISRSVSLDVGDPVGYKASIPVKAGDTLQSIALANNLTMDSVQNANPGMDPNQELTGEDLVFVPVIPPAESLNPIIPPFTSIDNPPSGEYLPPQGTDPGSSNQWSIIDNLKFWVKNTLPQKAQPAPESNTNSELPPAPKLFGDNYGCDVFLTVQTFTTLFQGVAEDGYFLYRSRDGGPYEWIATFPACDSNFCDYMDWALWDKLQYGTLTYYASTFNSKGENPGEPVTYPLDTYNCPGPVDDSKIHLDSEHNLVLPAGLDTAYVYLQLNQEQTIRVPEGDRMFLPGSGQKFNLEKTLDSFVDTVQIPDLQVHLEVWGWQGGQLVYVGAFDQEVHRTLLTICSMEGVGSCTGGGGGTWVREMNLVSNEIKPLDQQVYEIRWQVSSLSIADTVCLGLAEKFKDDVSFSANPTLLHLCYYYDGANMVGGTEGTYLLNLGQVLYPADKSSVEIYTGDPTANYAYSDFESIHSPGEPFDLELRSSIQVEVNNLDGLSNTVYMHYKTGAQANELPALASDVPSLYDIQILPETYVAPRFEIWENWGGIMVDSDPSGKYDQGEVLLPLGYVDCDVNVECEDPGFWGTLAKAWEMITDAYSTAKNAIIGAVADIIPYCSDSDLCKGAIEAGINYGLTALTGMPPDLPNYDELVSQGVTSVVVGQLAGISDPGVMDYVCGDLCQAEIASQMQPYLAQAKSYYSQPGCYSPNGHYGMFPPCVPPPAVVHPIDGAADFPGYVVVRITRKNTPESVSAVPEQHQDKVKIRLSVSGENSSRIGYYASSCKYIDNMTVDLLPDASRPQDQVANWGYHYLGDATMQGPIYLDNEFSVPWLAPGESIDIPVKLVQLTGWHPENCIMTADIQYLFFKGVSHMAADEYCYSSGSSTPWVPCTNGGSDRWDFANPTSPSEVIKYDINGNPVTGP